MQRRDFCKFLASTAALKPIPGFGETAQDSRPGPPDGFNRYTMDYAQFCALPPEKRVFYRLSGDKIVEAKPDDAAGKPSAWGEPSALPIPGGSWDGVPMESPIPNLAGEGPYKPTWDSLLQYDAPEWYRDAKFGIWAHWSPQCVPEAGDWYARNMYVEDQPQYKYHLEHYGPPSRFGYKDLCAQWTLLNWEPDELIARYKKAGARLFIALANHHDGFDTWDSKHQPWNAAAIGPHRDVVGTWAAAARKQGLRFGVTVHQARNWWWFQTFPWRGQVRSAGRRALRWRSHRGRRQRPVVAGARSAAALRREAPARRTARHLLCQELLRPHARSDRSARSRPALLRQFAAAAGLGRHEHRRVLLQPQPEDHRAAGWKRF